MFDLLKALIVGALGAAIGFFAIQSGIVRFGLPDVLTQLPRDLVVQERVLGAEEDEVVVTVEPVALDCRARIHADVTVTGRHDHRMAGLTYRTDTVQVDATGDVDTCVNADAATITERADGAFHVDIPGEAIRFVRPRVDMVASSGGVDYDKGFLGELVDLVPGVEETPELITGAFAHAQQVIGGRACMEAAFEVTRDTLVQAYADQLTAQGVDADNLSVTVGEPDFDQHPSVADIEGMAYEVAPDGITCRLAEDAGEGASVRPDLTVG